MAERGFEELGKVGYEQRAEWLEAVARDLEKDKDALARLMAEEMGKPVRDGRAEVEKCAWGCRHYAQHAESYLAPEVVETDPGTRSVIVCRPLGPVLAIMPWNFPLWQVLRFAAPSLMAGNPVLLKHAPNVPGCARAIEAIIRRAGFPAGSLVNLPIAHEDAERVIADPRVQGVTLTGSTRAGRQVAEIAGRHLKKCVLELGGSDPYLVLADADIAKAAKTCATSRLLNSGQTCIAAKRFLVVEEVHDEFVSCLREALDEAVMGDPLEEATTIGPMARFDLRDTVAEQVAKSIAGGAECLVGGCVPADGLFALGAYYPPTLLVGVKPGMPAFDEEVFGPVAAVVRVADEAEAIAMANQSSFGLGAAVFTRDLERGEEIAQQLIEAGAVAVNRLVASDPRLPFGGIKESGFGRELGAYGIREFVNIKTVTTAVSAED